MRIPIPCKKKRFRLTIGLRVLQPTTLVLIGRDAEYVNTVYVSRRVHFRPSDFTGNGASKEIRIPFPLAPQFMMFEIYDTNPIGNSTFQLEKFEVEPMEERLIWEHEDIHRMIPYANWFSQRAGYMPTGSYKSPDRKYEIEYLPIIRNDFGKPLGTPARQSRATGRIQASRFHLLPLSVPIRWFILLHERKHFQIPTRSEKVADLGALRVFLDFGFPKIEAIYASTKAMQATDAGARQIKEERLKDIHQFIGKYIEHDQPTSLGKAA